MREIVFDTETTGLDPFKGDKIVEIGAVELVNHVPTGVTFHKYINPERSVSQEVVNVHGLTEEFLSDKPPFRDIVDEFLAFIGEDSVLVAHNAPFDIKFVNAELAACGLKPLSNEVVDTVVLARRRFPGTKVNLDILCKKFNIDNSARTKHGALLDSELLAEVYLELLGGREPGLMLDKKESSEKQVSAQHASAEKEDAPRQYKEPRLFAPTKEELEQHFEFVKKIKNNIWGFTE